MSVWREPEHHPLVGKLLSDSGIKAVFDCDLFAVAVMTNNGPVVINAVYLDEAVTRSVIDSMYSESSCVRHYLPVDYATAFKMRDGSVIWSVGERFPI